MPMLIFKTDLYMPQIFEEEKKRQTLVLCYDILSNSWASHYDYKYLYDCRIMDRSCVYQTPSIAKLHFC